MKHLAKFPAALASLLLLLGVLTPWLALDMQERIRYSPAPERIWPAWTILTLVYFLLFAAAAILLRRHWRADVPAIPAAPPWRRDLPAVLLGVAVAASGWFCLTGLLHYYHMVWFRPISLHGDMLPLIQSTLTDFWRDGVYPYRHHEMPGYTLPLTFFPGLWLPFSIPWHFNADIRLWGVAALGTLAIVSFLLAWEGLRSRRGLLATTALFLPLFIVPLVTHLPMFRGFLQANHLPGYWLLLAMWGATMLNRNHLAAGILLGICLVSRPYIAILLPILLIHTAHGWREDPRGHLRLWAGLVAAAAVLALPFFLRNPEAFLYGSLSGYGEQLSGKVDSEPWRAHGIGLAGLMHQTGNYHLRSTLILVLLAVIYTLAWLCRRAGERAVVFFSAAALFAALGLMLIPWFYVIAGPLLLLALPRLWMPAPLPTNRALLPVFGLSLVGLLAVTIATSVFTPPGSLPHPARGGHERLHDSRLVLSGFDYTGWSDNRGGDVLHMTGQFAYLSVPLRNSTARRLDIDVHSAGDIGRVFLHVTVNQQPLAVIPLHDWPGGVVSVPVPAKTLFHGGNLLGFRLWRDGGGLTAEEVPGLDVRIGSTWFSGERVWSFE